MCTIKAFLMKTVGLPPMKAGGLKISSTGDEPNPHCSCFWPREAFQAAADLLTQIEAFCAGSATQQQPQHQEQEGEPYPSCSPSVESLVHEALESLVDVLRYA